MIPQASCGPLGRNDLCRYQRHIVTVRMMASMAIHISNDGIEQRRVPPHDVRLLLYLASPSSIRKASDTPSV